MIASDWCASRPHLHFFSNSFVVSITSFVVDPKKNKESFVG